MASVTANMGRSDRAIRGVTGAVLLAFGLFCPFAAASGAVVWGGSIVIGAILLGTAAIGTCPLYRMLGVSTRAGGTG